MSVSLREVSVETILAGQHPGGGLIASPSFATYNYCWIRDGSFIAYALDRVGQGAAAARFHQWVACTVLRHRGRAEAAIARAAVDLPPAEGQYLYCRYTLDGKEEDNGWPNLQLDGYGAWLWALEQHLTARGGGPAASLKAWPQVYAAAQLVSRYVAALWRFPNYDCWEEHGDRLHTSTMACLFGGLQAAARLLGDQKALEAAAAVRERVLVAARPYGHLTKHLDSPGIDASLLWCSTPFGLLAPDDELMQATVAAIEAQCVDAGGGVHRYPTDTYYGGGAWTLLTAWLGWYYRAVGRIADACRCLAWVQGVADGQGRLPEQMAVHLIDADLLPIWERRWGPSAHPLLWSHAMYLILLEEVGA